MDARKGNIYEILNGNKQFLIPVYQRFYRGSCGTSYSDDNGGLVKATGSILDG